MGSYVVGLINIVKLKYLFFIRIALQFALTTVALPLLRGFSARHEMQDLLVMLPILGLYQVILNLGYDYSGYKDISIDEELTKSRMFQLTITRLVISIFCLPIIFFLIPVSLWGKLIFVFGAIFLCFDHTWYFNFKGHYLWPLLGLVISVILTSIIWYITRNPMYFAIVVPLSSVFTTVKLNYFSVTKLGKLDKIQLDIGNIHIVIAQALFAAVFYVGLILFTFELEDSLRVDLLLMDRICLGFSAVGGISLTAFAPELSISYVKSGRAFYKIIMIVLLPSIILSFGLILLFYTNINVIHDYLDLKQKNNTIVVLYTIVLAFAAVGPTLTFLLTLIRREYLLLLFGLILIVLAITAICFASVYGSILWPLLLIANGLIQAGSLLCYLRKKRF